MLNFGQRSIFKQGGSFLISLPIQWIRSTNPENVNIEVDNEQRIIITPVPQARQDSEGTRSLTPSNEREGVSNGNYDIER